MDKPEYGPSNHSQPTKKQKLLKKLFGLDENETNNRNQCKTITTQSKLANELIDSSDNEAGDVLELTIENEYFVTPKKVNPNTTTTDTNTLAANEKTHTLTKSLTPKVNRILSQNRHVVLLSPIQKTPTRIAHTVVVNVSPTSNRTLSRSLVRTHAPQTQSVSLDKTNVTNTHKPNNTFTAKRFASAFSTRKRIPHQSHTYTHAPTNNQLPKRFTSASSQSVRTAQNTHANKRYQPYTLDQRSCSLTHARTSISRQYTLASNRHTVTQIQADVLSTHTNTLAQNHIIASTTVAHTHTQFKRPHNPYISTLIPIIPTPPHKTQSNIKVTIPNTEKQPTTHTERQTGLGHNLAQNSKLAAPKTKIRQLNNKYAPQGVHLAIAIDKNKNLSKNALKRITRNLVSQL